MYLVAIWMWLGPLSRQVTCPQAPCPQTPKCCHGEPAIKNLETNTTKCFQLPADPLLSPVPACLTTDCGKCTMTSPVLEIDTTTNEMTVPFSQDSLNQNAQGCVVRVMWCVSEVPGIGSTVKFDYDSYKSMSSGRGDVRVVLTCNGTGDGWEFTPTRRETNWVGNTSIVHVAECFGPTCENTEIC
ncbi:unnamed protein product, partial [Mesorhabditis belari]|uniref:Uncharacterized protein n=1 Tax=Mesorhabditis belari TaxID=2138241 RepID=A0AAF3F0W5_9BILA